MYRLVTGGCGDCICRRCLWYASSRCPYGGCQDERRAREEPYPGPVRKSWTEWDKPGEQAHWCRGGICYAADSCDRFEAYDPARHQVRECLDSVIEVFQDGFIRCGLIDVIGCEECYRRFEERHEKED